MAANPEFTLLYDGECPFCSREVAWLRRRDRHGRLGLIDISEPDFDPSRFGLTRADVERQLCGVLPDGTVVRGMESTRRAWRAVGGGWLVAPTGWPGLRWLFDCAYRVFARHRVSLGRWFGRRCDDACEVTPRDPH